ncbi:MAG: hypothetical protein KKD97_16430 [Gammaproteobacteria bacterium]|nr:hypothetical protein [Gammaproteobacteria bacterium]
MLKSDQQGFLIGEVLDVSKEMLSGQRAGLQVLSRIDANVSAMLGRGARQARSRQGGRSISEPSIPAVVPAPRTTGARIGAAGPIARAPRETTQAVARAIPAAAAAVAAATAMRDSRGRFVKAGATPGSQGKSTGSGGGRGDAPAPDEAIAGGENRIVEAIKETAAQSTDRMDPMIEAAKEVWEPMGRGWRASFGQAAEKKKERWYKRIWQALTRKKSADQEQGFAASASSGSGLLSGITAGITSRLAGLAGMVPAVLGRVFAPVAAAWAAWEVGKWIGGKVHDWLVSSGVQEKMFEWIDGMRAGWASLMERAGKAWDDWVAKPAQKAWSATSEAASKAYEGGVNLLSGAASSFAGQASKANKWVADSTGINVGGAAKSVAITAGGALGALIGRHEGDYGSFNRGRAGDSRGKSMDFANMSVSEVMALQALPKSDARRLFAVGKYQLIPSTMKEAVSALGISGGEKFTPDMQERIFRDFIVGRKRRAISDYINGRSDDIGAAAVAVSKEFASAENPRTGRGYYDGVAGNRASIPAQSVMSALRADRRVASASAPVISVPSIRSHSLVKPIGDGPDISIPPFSNAAPDPIKISFSDQIGQNVSDRSIAHIATGGLGGGG